MKNMFRSIQVSRIWHYLLHRYAIVVETGLLVLMVEFFNQGTLRKALSWGYHHQNELFLNIWIAFAIVIGIHALVGRTRPALFAVFACLFAISFISAMKVRTTAYPLFLWEIVFSSETRDAAKPLNDPINSQMAWGTAVAVLGVLALSRLPHFRARFHWAERAVLGVLSVFMLYTIAVDKPIPLKFHYNIFTISWDQAENTLWNGYLLSAAMAVDYVRPDKPSSTDKSSIESFVDGISRNKDIDKKVQPNIIVILSESFWDATQIKSATFSEDPIPFLHSLQKTTTGGTLLSPQFGGGTANVEFEVLSGNSMRFLPTDAIAYIEYMNHGVDSLASILARQGYNSTAINPFFNWFFNSRNVYKNLGFSRFIATEHFDPVYKGPYLEDREVMKKIMEETDKTPGPHFIFANTMENHGLYNDKFSSNPIRVSGNFSAETKNILENYATGINDADQSLKMLVDHYTETKQPTIIAFFGDHLPPFGDNYKAFRNAKFTTGTDDPDFLVKMYSTPFIVWNNYLNGPKEDLNISPSFLGPYVLHLAKQEGSYYTDYLYNLSKQIPMIPPKSYFGKMNIKETSLLEYQSLQYDNLFGGRYGYAKTGIQNRIVNPNFQLGYGKPAIRETSVKDGMLEVKGGRFENDSVIYLNGGKLETSFRDHETLAAKLPADEGKSKGKIEVRLMDSKKTVIAKSDEFEIELSK